MISIFNIFAKPAAKVEPSTAEPITNPIGEEPSTEPIGEIVESEHMDRMSDMDDISVVNIVSKTDDITWKTTIPFVPPITEGLVIKVYDGDTITIASKLPYEGSPMYRFQVRLNGVDSPELKSKCEDEKMIAKKSQQHLEQLILRKTVTLQNVSTEKYGRVLAEVYLGNIHINKYMIDNRFAVKYDGGTKISPASWSSYHEFGTI
jgi:micrococcal nuclease